MSREKKHRKKRRNIDFFAFSIFSLISNQKTDNSSHKIAKKIFKI